MTRSHVCVCRSALAAEEPAVRSAHLRTTRCAATDSAAVAARYSTESAREDREKNTNTHDKVMKRFYVLGLTLV